MRTLNHICNSSVNLKWSQNRKSKKYLCDFLLDACGPCLAIIFTRTEAVNALFITASWSSVKRLPHSGWSTSMRWVNRLTVIDTEKVHGILLSENRGSQNGTYSSMSVFVRMKTLGFISPSWLWLSLKDNVMGSFSPFSFVIFYKHI